MQRDRKKHDEGKAFVKENLHVVLDQKTDVLTDNNSKRGSRVQSPMVRCREYAPPSIEKKLSRSFNMGALSVTWVLIGSLFGPHQKLFPFPHKRGPFSFSSSFFLSSHHPTLFLKDVRLQVHFDQFAHEALVYPYVGGVCLFGSRSNQGPILHHGPGRATKSGSEKHCSVQP